MNVSFSTRGWQQIPWEQQVQMAETMRFGGIELYNVHKTPELTGRGGPLHRYTAAATARELWQKGLCIPCFDTACDIAGEDCTETVTALMQLAHDVQCPYVSVTAQRDDDARISAALEALLPAAEAQGITILLKTSGVFSDTARLRALLDAFACDQLGALWDMHHPYRDHGESADTTIKNLGAYVRHVHLRDSDDDGSYDLIGEGTLPVCSMMQALSSIDYDGFISLEWKPEWMPDLTDPEADALIAAAETLPFMADRRIVIIRECSLLTAGKKAENEDKAAQIAEYVERIPPTACVVFFVKGKADGRKKLYTLLKKKNAIVDFSPMSDAECADWARRTMARMGKQMTPRTADKLVFTVGRDAALLKQEMEKLAAYLADRPEVAEADIDAICTRSTECTVFQMVDAQVAGRNDVAFGLLKDMVRAGEDRIGILAMLLRQYRILYHMRSLMDERAPQQSQASLLGIPPFAVSRTQQQARRYDRARLKEAYESLLDYEQQIKGGLTPQEGCAENALLRLEAILRA